MKRIVCLVTLVAVLAPAVFGQALEIGVEQNGTLESDSKHEFTFDAESDFYVYGYVNQISVDVVVTIIGPDGKERGEFDSPARGPESFSFSTNEAGVHTIRVTPFEAAEGDYAILLISLEPKATEPEALVDQIMTPYAGDDVPGAVISVLKDGEIVLARGYGMANLTYGIPMDENTGMSVASVSKQFTAMAIMLLVNDGKLSLDDDVRTHIPELKDFGTPITLRNMLNHTSGYREILNLLPMRGWQFVDAMSREEPIRVIQRQPSLQNAPGTLYNYNNTTFMLLATVVERISEQDFGTFMKERVFGPLGMTNTVVKTHQGQVIPGSSQGYAAAEGGGYRYVTDFASAYGASGVNTSARDITRWMLNYRDGTVGGMSAIEAITTRGILVNGDTTAYGLGLGVGTYRGQAIWRHTGGETAHRTFFAYLPEIEGGVFFSSANPSFGLGMWSDLVDAFFGESLEPEEEEPQDSAEASSAKPSAEQLEAIAGKWLIADSLQIEYTVEEGALFAQETGQPKFGLDATSDSTFTFAGVPAAVTFHFEVDGTLKRATYHNGPDQPMTRVEDPELTEEQLTEYTGIYYSDELETSYTLKLDEGKLMAHHRSLDPFAVNHVQKETFGGISFFGTMEFDRDPRGEVSGFMASNGRTRNVWFEKRD